MLSQLTMSSDDNVFAFNLLDRSTGAATDCAVWVRNTNTTYVFPKKRRFGALDEIAVNKAGTVAQVRYADNTTVMWTFRSGATTTLDPTKAADDVGGHYDLGLDYIVNSDQYTAGVAERTYSALRPAVNVLKYLRPDGTQNWTIADHLSLRADDERTFVGSTYAGDGSWGAFEKEIYLAYTDGHGFVRLAHTLSAGQESDSGWRYWAQPRAVVSRDGHFVVYTSDLGSSARMDVMILLVPPELWPL
jgi:hypothetical protein